MKTALRHRLQLTVAALLFSTGGAAIKSCSLGAWPVTGFRAIIAAVAVMVMVPSSRRNWSRKGALVALAYATTVILFVRANKLTTAAATIFLQGTSPVYIVALGPWLLGERARRRDLAYMAVLAVALPLFFVGVDSSSRSAPDPFTGNILAIISGVACGLMMIGLRSLQRGAADAGGAPGAVVMGNLLAAAIALPFALPLRGGPPADWGLLLYLGVFQIAAAYAIMIAALRHVPALQASLLMFVEPVFSPIWAWLVHGERPGPWSLLGGALILCATAAYAKADASSAAPSATPIAAPPTA